MSASQDVKARLWTCKLCEFKKNPEEATNCRTCGRSRGFEPERYQKRLKEIRTWADEDEPEDGGIVEYCGLIIGLIILALIVAVLAWAYFHDQEVLRQNELPDEEL
mmetsp:Transcript_37724/g.70350  ORF Transcript_37724/g.70350 Transcript_37724/m.70350 type:complete len:106 (+) Transcript_37724:37-354(+)